MKLLRLPISHVGEALVVAEVEVGLGAVVGHEHFAVLERRHRAGIDVDVRIELEIGDADAAGGEDRGEGGGGDALAEGGNHAAGHEDELGHGRQVPEIPILQEFNRQLPKPAVSSRDRRIASEQREHGVDRGRLARAGDERAQRHHHLRGFRPWRAAAALIAAPIASRAQSSVSNSACNP